MFKNKQEEVEWGEKQEQTWADHWAYLKKCKLTKGPQYDDFDYMCERNGRLDHFLEIKARAFVSTAYEHTLVPIRKHVFARAMTGAGYASYLLCVWTDKAGYIELWKPPAKIDVMTRQDRGTGGLYAYYPVKDFSVINF